MKLKISLLPALAIIDWFVAAGAMWYAIVGLAPVYDWAHDLCELTSYWTCLAVYVFLWYATGLLGRVFGKVGDA